MKKCLIAFNDENYIIHLNGSRLDQLMDAIKKKRELYNLLSCDSKMHEFLVISIYIFNI